MHSFGLLCQLGTFKSLWTYTLVSTNKIVSCSSNCQGTSYIRTQVKSCMKPGEGVNPGTHFLKPGDKFPQPGVNPEQAWSKPGPNPGPKRDETRWMKPETRQESLQTPGQPGRWNRNPGSTRSKKNSRSGSVRQAVLLVYARAIWTIQAIGPYGLLLRKRWRAKNFP